MTVRPPDPDLLPAWVGTGRHVSCGLRCASAMRTRTACQSSVTSPYRTVRSRSVRQLSAGSSLRPVYSAFRSELTALTVNDVESHADGLVVTVRRSKTDQEAAGQRVGIPYGSNPRTCPVRTLDAWCVAAKVEEGPLLRPVDRHGNVACRHLSGRAVAEIVKRRADAVGLASDQFSGHSLRAGLATSAAAAGATEVAIARQTRHQSMAVLRRYIREGGLFRTNAATVVGL